MFRPLSSIQRFFPLAALCLMAFWPVARAGYPTIGDGLIHYYRLVEFAHLLQAGVWFPRWASDLAYGFGYPLFNFYPPLTYYLGTGFLAFGLIFEHSLLAVYAMAFALATVGAYQLGRALWGEVGGWVAAGVYATAPYLYFNTLARGALPETLALGLLPWALWAYVGLARTRTRARVALAVVVYAALLLTHFLTAFVAVPLLLLVYGLALPQRWTWRDLWRALGVGLWALALAGFFLLPALLETGTVQIGQLTNPGDLDFRNHFLPLTGLFAWPQPFDARLVFIEVPPSLSTMALMLASTAVGLTIWRARALSVSAHVLGLALVFGVYVFFTQAASQPLWEALPLARILQFPWRLVGPASLLLALLTAASVWGLAQRLKMATQWQLANLPLVLCFFFALSWSFAPQYQVPFPPVVASLTAYELTGQLGTTSTGEFLPNTVKELPPANTLQAAYQAQTIIPRVGPLPPGVQLLEQTASVQAATATVQTPITATLTFQWFAFPGWSATLDGQPVAIIPSDPHGLITLTVPPGQHHLALTFGLTPLRGAAITLSIVAGLALLWYAFFPASVPLSPKGFATPAPALAGALALLPLALLLVRAFFLDDRSSPFNASRFDGATVAGVTQALDVNFANELVLLGYDTGALHDSAGALSLAANGALPLTLFWRAQNLPAADYATTVQVLDDAGHLFGQADSQHPGRVPTSRWRLDQYAADRHLLTLLPGTPPGHYRLVVGVYQVNGPPLSVLDEHQIPQGIWAELGTVLVTRGDGAASPPNQPLLEIGPLRVLDYALNTTTPQAGDTLQLQVLWQTPLAQPEDLKVRWELIDTVGGVIGQNPITMPARPDYGVAQWTAGEVVRAYHAVRVPATAPAGPATLRLSVLTAEGETVLGMQDFVTLTVRVPERSFTLPTISHPLTETLGGQVALLGYDLTPEGIVLYWQALTPLAVSYTAFVHGLNPAGQLVSQVDVVPVNGTRPTTGWLPGEIITDRYVLDLSQATTLEVGLYDPLQPGPAGRLGTVVFEP